ncbi:hypothetical protein VD0002_g2733 [Verticillium dahliae]|uniref:Uncharacterized protein n=1 Tax=Verticillium dahliae TaxID=27337 RepID=A0AA44WN78_VERDA|nr:hypothetical protein EV126DRAFT_497052 [Verticillium dahliae]PNH33860.1 hypothetical protein BJF96_g2825 [Verticillium dahliae]PNH50064.1 hypothetical protein VD0003_g7098 [Verticillium dahliae]PNH66701.1 hypothetical protein VD0002_g2733 [Verticillium dahliae]
MSAQTPPLLLTKRLTAFLAANLSPTLHAALLTTPSGKLLAHASTPAVPLAPAPAVGSGSVTTTNSNTSTTATAASPPTTTTTQSASPVALLRTQATVAASLYALHAAAAPALAPALPESATPPSLSSSSAAEPDAAARPAKPLAITVQLSHGVLLIRRLKCGLLFVCIGPLPEDAAGAATGPHAGQHADGGLTPASPDDRDSVLSAGAATTVSVASSVAGSVGGAAVVAMRRQAEELARWLDDKLGSLRVPEEGVGVE